MVFVMESRWVVLQNRAARATIAGMTCRDVVVAFLEWLLSWGYHDDHGPTAWPPQSAVAVP
jgi:hypothetical protein